MRDLLLLPDKGAKQLFTTALEVGYTSFLVPKSIEAEIEGLARSELYVLDGERILKDGEPVGIYAMIKSPADQTRLKELAGRHRIVVVATKDWRVIPLENLIAWYTKSGTTLFAEVADVDTARLALQTLERGVDGLVVTARDRATLQGIRTLLTERGAELALETAEIVEVRPLPSGDRVLVDTTAMMNVGEGMLVGSQAEALFLVHSESLESGYVASRPFRVNAGAVHAYILTPGDRTRYLAELEAGDGVLVIDQKGRSRAAVVGRVKIEERPLVLVKAKTAGKTFSIILQNAETVALITPEGPKSVAALAPGDRVLIRIGPKGRHFGTAVDERIVER